MILLHKSTLLPLIIFCLLAGCKQKSSSIDGQWQVIAGSHIEEGQEAWLEISSEYFTMIGRCLVQKLYVYKN